MHIYCFIHFDKLYKIRMLFKSRTQIFPCSFLVCLFCNKNWAICPVYSVCFTFMSNSVFTWKHIIHCSSTAHLCSLLPCYSMPFIAFPFPLLFFYYFFSLPHSPPTSSVSCSHPLLPCSCSTSLFLSCLLPFSLYPPSRSGGWQVGSVISWITLRRIHAGTSIWRAEGNPINTNTGSANIQVIMTVCILPKGVSVTLKDLHIHSALLPFPTLSALTLFYNLFLLHTNIPLHTGLFLWHTLLFQQSGLDSQDKEEKRMTSRARNLLQTLKVRRNRTFGVFFYP